MARDRVFRAPFARIGPLPFESDAVAVSGRCRCRSRMNG